MKKSLSILFALLFTLLFLFSFAKAEEWRYYRLEEEPGYLVYLPESYYCIYRGMPENDPVFTSLRLTEQWCEGQLSSLDAFVIAMPIDRSTHLNIAKREDTDRINYQELSPVELESFADKIGDFILEDYKQIDYMTVSDFASFGFSTEFANYVITSCSISSGTVEQGFIQAFSSDGENLLLFSYMHPFDEYLDQYGEFFIKMLDNFIIL